MEAKKLDRQQENLLRAYGQIERAEENSRKVVFVASTEARDRHGTVIPIDAWRLDNFDANGIAAYMHETSGDWWSGRAADPDYILGPARVWVDTKAKQLMVEIDFEDEENDKNPLSEKIYRKVLRGTLKAVSVGFRALKGHWGLQEDGEDTGTYYFDEVELLEVSVVNIPSNPEAVKRSYDQFLSSTKGESMEDTKQKDTTKDVEADRSEESKSAKIIELENDRARLNLLKIQSR